MPTKGLKCPDCGTLVKKPPAGLSGVVQCPECHTEIWYDPRFEEEQTGLQTQPSPEPPPLWALPADDDKADRSRPKNKRPSPPKKKSGGKGLLIGLSVAGVLVLVLGGGSALVWWKWGKPTPSGPELTTSESGLLAGGTGETGLPLDTLQHLKRATVFVKVQRGRAGATGSGFVVNTVGDATFVVTNDHVVSMPATMPGPIGPRPPFGPIGPLGPMFGGPTVVQLVFHSGTPREETVQAEVVHKDVAQDLALLVCRGVKEVPKPIKVDQQPKLVETMPLVIFGFPFGEELAVDRANPTITVTKGNVSGLSTNAAGELSEVRIDGDLNPGNSGGPVTDVRGNLIGVAVAKMRGTKIGMVIPAQEVKKLLPKTEKQPLAGG